MDELWPAPAPEVADAIRWLCQHLFTDTENLVDLLAEAGLTAQNENALLSDASLVHEDRQLDRSEVVQWLTSNIQRPGNRVEPYVGPRTTAYISDLVSRGIAPDFAEGWRAALAVAWRRWLEECVQHCPDPELLVGVLDTSAMSLVQYALDSVATLREASLAAAMGNADAEAIAVIQMIASGAPITEDLAEARLRYRMARWHAGFVLWVDDPQQGDALEEAAASLRSTVSERSALVARASATSRWIWISGSDPADLGSVEDRLESLQGVRAAGGRSGRGLAGFRSTHQDALAAQALVVRLGSHRRFTTYADVELIDALTQDRASARRFVLRTLGPLADADEELQRTLLTYVQCGFNTTRAAASLFAHRNTVERRVSRANELSVVTTQDNPTQVAAALMVLSLAPDIVVSSA